MRIVSMLFQTFAIILLTTQFSLAAADSPAIDSQATYSPAGLWQTIDDKSRKPRSLIRINENAGEYSAVVEKGLLATDTGDAVCEKCTDERKGQPIIGMTIVSGLKKNGDYYDGGRILDPENGKVYKCKMTLNETGDALEVRGYIGFHYWGALKSGNG